MPTRWWTGAPAVSSAPPRRFGRVALAPRGRQGRVPGRRRAPDATRGDRRGRRIRPGLLHVRGRGGPLPSHAASGVARRSCAPRRCSSTSVARPRNVTGLMYYREQVRGHLRVSSRSTTGVHSAEEARRFLRVALRVRALVATGEARRCTARRLAWLGSADVDRSSGGPGSTPDRTGPRRIEPPVTPVEGRRERERQDRPLDPVLARRRLDLVVVVVDLRPWRPGRVPSALVTNFELGR